MLVLPGVLFIPTGGNWSCLEIFLVVMIKLNAISIWWVETKNDTKHLRVSALDNPYWGNHLAPSVSSAKTEKPSCVAFAQ